jgi:hypothetical protein
VVRKQLAVPEQEALQQLAQLPVQVEQLEQQLVQQLVQLPVQVEQLEQQLVQAEQLGLQQLELARQLPLTRIR